MVLTDKCFTESIKLWFVFGFCWFNHEGPRYGPWHSWGMETLNFKNLLDHCKNTFNIFHNWNHRFFSRQLTIIHKPFRNVHGFNFCSLLQLANVYNKFMGTKTSCASEQSRVVPFQLLTHIICIQDCYLSGLPQSLRSHHLKFKKRQLLGPKENAHQWH